MAWSTALTRQLEQEIEILAAEERDDNLGEIGTPKLRFTSSLSLLWNDWEMMIQNRFIGDGQQDNPPPFAPNRNFIGMPDSRPVDFVDAVWTRTCRSLMVGTSGL